MVALGAGIGSTIAVTASGPQAQEALDALEALVGDGGLHTTVEDLARWDANFYGKRDECTSHLSRVESHLR